ncbi:MAG: lysylphosphatidylglycerol synthase transmembrane domain-containing protein, partial [Acidobacteriota bacterium]
MNRTPAAPTTGRLARQILSVCLWAAAVVFLARTARGVGWGVLGDRLADAAPLLVGLTFLVTLLRYAAWGTRWQILLRPIERVPWWAAQRALMASLFVTTVVPASRPFGGLVRARHLGRAIRRPAGPLYGGTVVDQFGYGIVSTSLGAVSLPFALWAGRAGGAGDLLLWVAGGAAIIAALALAWRRKGSIVDRLRRRAPKMAGALEGAAGSARDLAARPSTWGVMAAGGALVWWANVLTF